LEGENVVDLTPVYIIGAVIGLLAGLLLGLGGFLWKVPEARFYAMTRLFRSIIVRVHYANDIEQWYRGKLGPEGLIIEDSKGNMLAINPDKLNRGKSSFAKGFNYVDVGSNSLWPVGQREGLLVNIIDDYIDDPESGCVFLKSREQMERHTLLHATKTDLPGKIQPMLNVDPGAIKITEEDAHGKNQEQVNALLMNLYHKLVFDETKKVMDEIARVKTALEGRVVFDQPFSWSNACFAINSQLQPENVKKLDMIIQRLAYDKDAAKDKQWTFIYMGLICFGAVVVGIIGTYKLLFG
jgi:hypothetical protein